MSRKPLDCILAIDAFMLASHRCVPGGLCPASHREAARPQFPQALRPCSGIAKLVPASVGELLAAGELHWRCGGDGRLNAAMNAAGKPSARPPAARSLDNAARPRCEVWMSVRAVRMRMTPDPGTRDDGRHAEIHLAWTDAPINQQCVATRAWHVACMSTSNITASSAAIGLAERLAEPEA